MDILEILYENEIKKQTFYPRKLSITNAKTIIYGPRKSGKTTIIYDYLSSKKKGSYLYIDFDDIRINQSILIGLSNFIVKKGIETLVLENFDFSFTPPGCKEVIITTEKKRELEGFESEVLYPLDFEEFIAFKRRDAEIETLFNEYATIGSFPSIVLTHRESFVKRFQEELSVMMNSPLEWTIYRAYALHQGQVVSSYSLFKEIKLFHKISKDKFYEITKSLQDRGLLYLIPKYGSKRGGKKIFLVDFAIKSVLTFEKDFIKRFENMLFLELLKRGEEPVWSDLVELYLPLRTKAVMPLVFMPKEMIREKIGRAYGALEQIGAKRVEVVTLEVEDEFRIEGLEVEVVPFWNWALRD